MSNEKASKSHEPSDSAESNEELSDAELAKVAGGTGVDLNPPPVPEGNIQPPAVTDGEIISPRDPASGMPTGKRMHKPFTIT